MDEPIVFVEEDYYDHCGVYRVMVDYRVYDSFISRGKPLTFKEQADIAAGYREALTNYEGI